VNSICIAYFIVGILPELSKMVAENEIDALEFVGTVLIFLLPAIVLIYLTPMVLTNFVMVANIQNMRNRRVVEQGIRRLKTRNAFLTLKVIYMMVHGAKGSLHEGIDWEELPDGTRRHNKTTSGHKRPQDSNTEIKRKRIVWKQVFNIFDNDGGGTASKEEIRDLMTTTDPSIRAVQIDSIMKVLDRDNDGNIDFDEFFRFCEAIDHRNTQSSEEISDGIFDLIDQGANSVLSPMKSGSASVDITSEMLAEEDEIDEVDIAEVELALHKMKQDLSPDDVYAVMKDMDENGNGRLDRKEFKELLLRLDVIREDA
jgi:calmodulin